MQSLSRHVTLNSSQVNRSLQYQHCLVQDFVTKVKLNFCQVLKRLLRNFPAFQNLRLNSYRSCVKCFSLILFWFANLSAQMPRYLGY